MFDLGTIQVINNAAITLERRGQPNQRIAKEPSTLHANCRRLEALCEVFNETPVEYLDELLIKPITEGELQAIKEWEET